MPTGAQLIVDLLEQEGVEVAFGLPGVHNLALWEALRGSPIRLVGVRHEQAAAYAADGYARATGKLGVALTTTGPGAANTLGAVGEAWASRSPILVIATDIPAALRRPGVYRGVLHETTDQAAMFAPVVKATHRRAAEDAATVAATARSRAPSPRRRGPSTWGSPTDLLAAEAPAGAAPTGRRVRAAGADRAVERRRGAARSGRAAADLGGRAARSTRRGEAARWPSGSPRPCITTYGARRAARRRPPVRGRDAAARRAAGRAVGRGRSGDRHRLGPRRRADAELRPAAAAAMVAINLDAEDATKNYRADIVLDGDAARCDRARGGRARRARRLDGLAARLREVRARRLRRARRRARCGSSTRSASRVPDDGDRGRATCASRATGSPASTRPRARASCRSRSAGARSATRSRPRSARRSRTAGRSSSISGDGGFLYALRRAGDGRPGADPADRRDRRRRRLRDAPLRPGRAAATDRYGVDLRHARLRALARAFGIRAEPVDGLDDEFGAALAEHVLDPEPSVLVARRRSRSSRRRTRRRTGTGAARSGPAPPSRVPDRPPPPRGERAPDAATARLRRACRTRRRAPPGAALAARCRGRPARRSRS